MNTPFILLAQYQTAIVPLDLVCRDYFRHLTPESFARKSLAGEIAIPVVQIEGSQKAAKGVHISDLATWIDARRADAVKELARIHA